MRRRRTGHAPRLARNRGFTYLGVLFLVVIMGIALAAVADVWHTTSRRSREAELLFVGDQFRRAIEAYRTVNAKVGDGFPKDFAALLTDPNQPAIRRYLRRVYLDPMTNSTEWGLIKTPAGNIMGVFSLSKDRPLKLAGFDSHYPEFATAKDYGDWKFMVGVLAPEIQPAPGALASAVSPVPGAGPVAVVSGIPAPAQPAAEPPEEPDDCEIISQADQTSCQVVLRRWGEGDYHECLGRAENRLHLCHSQGKDKLPALWLKR